MIDYGLWADEYTWNLWENIFQASGLNSLKNHYYSKEITKSKSIKSYSYNWIHLRVLGSILFLHIFYEAHKGDALSFDLILEAQIS